jgi:hypothetical protein
MISMAREDCPVVLRSTPVQEYLDLADDLRQSETTGNEE